MLLLADSRMFGNVMNSDNVPPRYNSNRWSEFKMTLMFCFSALNVACLHIQKSRSAFTVDILIVVT